MRWTLTIQGISIVSFVPITLVKRKYSMNIFGTSMVIVAGVSQLLRQIIFWTKIMINYTTLNVLLVIVMSKTQMKKLYYHIWLIFTILVVHIKHFACTKILPRPFHTHVWVRQPWVDLFCWNLKRGKRFFCQNIVCVPSQRPRRDHWVRPSMYYRLF